MAAVVAGLAVVLWLVWTLALLPIQWIAVGLDLGLARWLPVVYHRGVCRLFGLDVVQIGSPSRVSPTLFVANHCSYFDIAVIGSRLPLCFIARREIRDWPLLGLLARLQRSVFVDPRRSATRTVRDEIGERLAAGDNLVLFPEAGIGDGNRLSPFRSAFLSSAERPLAGRQLWVQPLTVAYVRQGGLPIGHTGRARLAWYGDMAIGPHFWQAIQNRTTEVVIHFHPPVEAAAFSDRKALTRHCFAAIDAGREAALRGRPYDA
jgi:1-acyl-sn-glycerol-3-phosphate acyltransferase